MVTQIFSNFLLDKTKPKIENRNDYANFSNIEDYRSKGS